VKSILSPIFKRDMMSDTPEEEPFDRQIELLVKAAAALGFNPIRVRWKLRAFVERATIKSKSIPLRIRHISYANKVCPNCGAVHSVDARNCSQCGARLDSKPVQILRRIGLVAPQLISASTVLGAFILLAYFTVLRDDPEGSFFSLSWDALARHGSHIPRAVNDGQWWRLGSAIFLHGGLLHLGFNLLALIQVGPQIEELFDRRRMVTFFMMTGIFANLVSNFLIDGSSVGASGALMGLIGVAVGWGQRDGTSVGRQARNAMLKWGLYTIAIGIFIPFINNVAHVAGFVSGAILGYLVLPRYRRDTAASFVDTVFFLLSAVIAAISVAFTLFPALSEIW
jgi:rhomboid protease GluP